MYVELQSQNISDVNEFIVQHADKLETATVSITKKRGLYRAELFNTEELST